MNVQQSTTPTVRQRGGLHHALWRALFLLGLAAPGLAAAQIVSVGPESDPACTFNDLQAAVNSVPPGGSITVRLSAAQGYQALGPVLVIDRNLRIEGGYNGCSAREPLAGTRSVVASLSGSAAVISVFSSAQPVLREVLLRDLEIRDGLNTRGGGLYVTGFNRVVLERSHVIGNTSQGDGGGIWVGGDQGAYLRLAGDSLVAGNQSRGRGGGIRCEGATLDAADARIDANIAGTHGGGIAMERCTLLGPSQRLAVTNNQVDATTVIGTPAFDVDGRAAGGGLHLAVGSRILGAAAGSVFEVSGNSVLHARHGSWTDRGDGGGIKLLANAEAELGSAHISYNTATRGGGAWLGEASRLVLAPRLDACPGHASFPGCASVFGNAGLGFVDEDCGVWGGSGGAIASRGLAAAELRNVTVRSNRVSLPSPTGCSGTPRRAALGDAFEIAGRSALSVAGSLVGGNNGSRESDVIHVRGESPLFRAEYSTIADNSRFVPILRTAGGGEDFGPRIELVGSIFDQPSGELYRSGGGFAEMLMQCTQVTELSALLTVPDRDFQSVQVGDPRFLDRLDQDYGLAADSPAIDRCFTQPRAGTLASLDGGARPLLSSSRDHSPFDIGAFEHTQGVSLVDLELTTLEVQVDPLPGEVFEYRVVLRNRGPAAAAGAFVVLSPDPATTPSLPVVAPEGPWSCEIDAGQVVCRIDQRIDVQAFAPTLRLAMRAPPQPDQLRAVASASALPGEVDGVPGNNEVALTHGVAFDADLEALDPPKAALTLLPGEPVFFDFHFYNHGPDVAWQPRVELQFPAAVEGLGPLILAKEIDPSGWSCGDPQRLADGRQQILCDRPLVADGDGVYLSMVGVVPLEAAGDSWTVLSRISSVSDPGTAGRRDNHLVQDFQIAEAVGLVLDGTAPAVVALDRPQAYSLEIENRGTTTFTDLRLGGEVLGGEFDDIELVAGDLAGCTPYPATSKDGEATTHGFECQLSDPLPPGGRRRIELRLTPRLVQSTTWRFFGLLREANSDYFVIALESPVDPASLPPQDQVFGSGFE